MLHRLLFSFQNKQASLWNCFTKSCWRMFAVSGLFKLFGDLCGLVGPLSISYIVEFINLQVSHRTTTVTNAAVPVAITVSGAEDNSSQLSSFNNATYDDDGPTTTMMNDIGWSEFIGNGWVMSGIVLISFLLQGTFSQASTNLINIEGIKIKNALQGLIYRKTLSLRASCFYTSKQAKNKSDGNCTAGKHGSKRDGSGKGSSSKDDDDDDDCDLNNPGTITNLMSDDSLNVMTFFWICHYVWSIPLKVRTQQRSHIKKGQHFMAS